MGAKAKERRNLRRDARQQRVETRQAGKTARVVARSEAKAVAYANGIDPKANLVNGIASGLQGLGGIAQSAVGFSSISPEIGTVAQQGGGFLSGIFNRNQEAGVYYEPVQNDFGQIISDNKPIIIVAVLFLLALIFKPFK